MGTPREQLASLLKQARLDAGFMTHGKLASAMSLSRSVVVKAESPNGPTPTDETLAAWSKATGCDLPRLLELALRCKSGAPAEWFMPYLSAEAEATYLRFWGPFVIPGLLQTEGYARALLSVEPWTPEQLAELVRIRMERQKVIGKARIIAVIEHGVLLRCIGSPAIMAEQCAHVVELAESQKIRLHIVPEGANIGLGGAHAIVTKNTSSLVSLTTTIRDITSTAPDVVEGTLGVFDAVLGMALAPVPSLEYIKERQAVWKEHS